MRLEWTFLVLAVLGGSAGASASPAPPDHPRLFLPARTELVRTVPHASPHHAAAWATLLQRVDEGLAAYDGRPGYRASALAREAAFAYQVTGDARYARLARRTLLASRQADQDQPDRGYGLSRAMMSVGYALAYDWCHPAWSETERAEMLGILRAAADAWPEFEHPNVSTAHRGSNWVGVTRGGELLLHLAARGDGAYGHRADRIALCLADLHQHLATAYGPSGWTQEGLGYLEYTFGFLAPALLAAEEAGFEPGPRAYRDIAWHRLAMMACSFRDGRQVLQSGVGGPSSSAEGFASLAWLMVPAGERASYRFFYDRHLGVEAARPTYDRRRAGTIWALLLYQPSPDIAPPTPTPLLDSDKGAYYFRNRWRDRDDILVSLMTRADQHSHAWQQPETWQIGLMGFDSTFAGGPGKERTTALYSKLLIDGRTGRLPREGGARDRVVHVAPDGGGAIESDAAGNFGLTVAHRRFSVDFPGESGVAAVIRIEDRLENTTPFRATFQLRPEDSVAIESLSAEGESPAGFAFRGRNGWLRGWVISPAESKITANGTLRVHTPVGTKQRLSVVLAVGQGEMPRRPPAEAVSSAGRQPR